MCHQIGFLQLLRSTPHSFKFSSKIFLFLTTPSWTWHNRKRKKDKGSCQNKEIEIDKRTKKFYLLTKTQKIRKYSRELLLATRQLQKIKRNLWLKETYLVSKTNELPSSITCNKTGLTRWQSTWAHLEADAWQRERELNGQSVNEI